MKKILIFGFLVFMSLSYPLKAQYFAEKEWHEGIIYLEDDTLKGRLKYELARESIMLEVGNQILTYSSRKVRSFEFYDQQYHKDRLFVAAMYAKKSDYKTPTFFEVLYQDEPVSLLCREELQTQTNTAMHPNPWMLGVPNTFISYVVKPNFYFLFSKNNKIKYFDGNKKEIFTFLSDQEKPIKEYFKKNKVRLNNIDDLINLIAFYNALQKK